MCPEVVKYIFTWRAEAIKILIACDKYKGSLSALEVCSTIAEAIGSINQSIETISSPMADGGEGTVKTLVESEQGQYVRISVKGPLGGQTEAEFGIINGDTAVIEMASASGMWLVPKQKLNPMETTTFGTGQLIAEALDKGCKKVIIGIGGSATNDGGMGMAQALGIKFYGQDGKELGLGGKNLSRISRIDMGGLHPKAAQAEFDIACDVDNPLTGKHGAAYVYGPQKGADENMVAELDRGLKNFASRVFETLNIDVDKIAGAGAAGGLGAGLAAFLNARLRPGTEIIIEATRLEDKIQGCSLVITGEGAMDKQTFFGKSAYGVANLAKKYSIPVISINGSVFFDREELKKEHAELFSGNFSIINRPMELEEAVADSKKLLGSITREIIYFYLIIANKMAE